MDWRNQRRKIIQLRPEGVVRNPHSVIVPVFQNRFGIRRLQNNRIGPFESIVVQLKEQQRGVEGQIENGRFTDSACAFHGNWNRDIVDSMLFD